MLHALPLCVFTFSFLPSRSNFSPGLLYVMLSRVRSRKQLIIVGRLKPSDFSPITIDLHHKNF